MYISAFWKIIDPLTSMYQQFHGILYSLLAEAGLGILCFAVSLRT